MQAHIGAFRPTPGFSVDDAAQAEYVTIVGGPLGISESVAGWLPVNGCKIDRLGGKSETDTKRMMDGLVDDGRRFWSFYE